MVTISEEVTAATLLAEAEGLTRMVLQDLAELFDLLLLLHTDAKWPTFLQSRHSLPAAGQSTFL
jgi:hypothetical protein